MAIFTHALVFERGVRADRRLPFTPPSMTLGRASECDISIPDPLLSRTHCRFEMRDGYLWVVDLESANETLVNDNPVKEQMLLFGDVVAVGDSTIRIERTETAASAPVLVPIDDDPTGAPVDVVIDLGFDKTDDDDAQPKKNLLRPLLWLVAAILILGGGITYIQSLSPSTDTTDSRPVPQDNTLLIFYEKVEASAENIFRFEMSLAANGRATAKVDDIVGTRHIAESKQVEKELLEDLARDLEGSGFFSLNKEYTGFALNPNTLNDSRLTIAIGKRIHTCRVTNRSDEPDAFRTARERIETFSKNELDLWVITLSTEKLLELAENNLEVARKRYTERHVKYGNLFDALRNYREAIVYLDSVNPKPEFYADIIDGFETAKEKLQEDYEDQRFKAERASKLKDWQTAVNALKIICEMIPDRSDPRHKEAMPLLIDAEKRLRQK
jgi:pSer/pThr/pTyr-binding forkhead associated (FHA) protein